MSSAARRRDERGSVAVELALGVGVLLLPVAVIAVLLPTWVERQSMARLAAQEAARAVVLAADAAAGRAAAEDAARAIADNHGMGADLRGVEVDGALVRGGVVTATVRVHVPVTALPFAGDVGGFTVTARHREPVDRYRSFAGD